LSEPIDLNPRLESIQDKENSEEISLKIISKTTERLDCYYDKNGPFGLVGNELLWNMIAQLKYKGTKLRLITEITKENIAYCKTMMRYFDVRHMDEIKGNFGISDQHEYLANILSFSEKQDKELVHIDVKSFVELQQNLFDTLWNRAVPAKEKIKEIELGLDKEFLETLSPQETKKTLLNLLGSATYEILVLFSTANSFYRSEREGILHVLKDAVKRGVNVRLLVPTRDDDMKEIVEDKLREKRKQIQIQYIRKPLQTNIIILIVDQAISLSIEINNDMENNFEQASGQATFSNIESTVSSCASIFESLWIQSELDKQNRIKQVYFDAFMGQGIKDETYRRQWQNMKK
jgi:two-component system sensor histidine kinase VicK